MTRMALAIAAGFATLAMAGSVAAADYPDPFGSGTDLRSGYPSDWDNSDANDPLDFELGLRYWYSWGAQSFSVGTGQHGTMTENDQTHMVEGHFRIDDNSTKTYVKGLAGMSFKIDGSSSDDTGSISFNDGHVAYAGADIGYSWLGDAKTGTSFGPFAGYMYWNDSPNTHRDDYTTLTSAPAFDPVTGLNTIPRASEPNSVELNMLRLGFSGKANLGSMFDITGEVAAVPYAKITGTLGSGAGAEVCCSTLGNVTSIQSSPTSIDGWGYGAMAEAFLGFHPTDAMTVRVGGRAWYLQGTADATFTRATIGDPTDSDSTTAPNFDTAGTFSNQARITQGNPWSLFRYGLLAELTYNF